MSLKGAASNVLREEEMFAHRHEEASDLRELLHRNRIFEIQAESVLIRRLRLSLMEETLMFQKNIGYLFLSAGLLTIAYFGYGLIGQKLGRTVLGGSFVIFAINVFRVLRRGHLKDHTARLWPWSGWELFDPDHLPKENRVVTRRLCSFLDSTEIATSRYEYSQSCSLHDPLETEPLPRSSPPHPAPSIERLAATSALYNFPIRSKGYFRLLALEPAGFDQPIVCRLVVCLFGQGTYDALSYVWGDAKQSTSITVNGQLLEIGRNLDTALRYLRHETKQRVLWVDAICINQRDTAEKNCLVAAMSDIYEQAKRVVVFLGPNDCLNFFEFCNNIASDDACDDHNLDDTFERLLDKPGSFAIFADMVHILSRPWWSRAWILQEMAYAESDPLIMFGCNSLPARVLYRVFKQFHDRIRYKSNPTSVEGGDRDDCLRVLERAQTVLLWRARLSPAMHSIADLLQLTSGQVASDPRDKVFAFQSLMMEPMRSAFAPDYGKSTASIYTRLATYLLCIEKWSRLYREFPIGVDKTSPSRPSWVPDFSNSCHDETCSQLWVDAPPLKIRDLEAVVDFGVLLIRGIYCGQVVAASALKSMHAVKFLVGGLASEAKGPLSCLLQSTLAAFRQGKKNKGKDDFLHGLYLAVRARPQSSFFTIQNLKVLLSSMSQGLPCRTTKLLESLSSDPDTTEYSDEILDALASDVRQKRKRQSEKWMDRFDRLGLFMSKQLPNILPPETDCLVQQYREDLQQSSMKYGSQKKSYYESKRKKLTDQVTLDHIMFITDTGLAGVGPSTTRPGDSVVVLYGIDTAFIARQIGDSQTMVLVGMVWLHQDVVAKVEEGVETELHRERLMCFK